jgi:hypothetical protein
MAKRRGQSDFGAAADDPSIIALAGGDGLTYRVPTREAKDLENGHERTVRLPVLEAYKACERCDGDWTRDRAVVGGWLPHYRRQGETWYPSARACPICAFGAYRHHCTRAPFLVGWESCAVRDLAILGPYLKPGVLTLRAGIELVPFPAVRERLRRGIASVEVLHRLTGSPEAEHSAEPQPMGIDF